MTELMLVGGVVVALVGVIQASGWRERRAASPADRIRDAMASAEGAEAGALRAEFRLSGVTPPEPRARAGFL